MKQIVLASTSVYRQALLKKAGLDFSIEKPLFNEDEQKKTLSQQLKSGLEIAEHLSKGKANSIWSKKNNPDLIVIGSDQLVSFKNKILGKPGSLAKAFEQLQNLSNSTHELITACTIQTKEKVWQLNHITTLKMKKLSDVEIENYLKIDEPFDCAGSYKIEKSGIILFENIECSDFTAIQGLPMIWVTNTLKELGYEFFKKHAH